MKLNLGCGGDIREGFINIDIDHVNIPNYLQYDLTKGLPDSIAANSVDFVYSCHSLEHFYPWDRDNLLVVVLNKLKPGGTLRLVLPDFKKLATAYLNKDWTFFNPVPFVQHAPLGTLMELVNWGTYQYDKGTNEHKSLYDAEYTIALLKSLGYNEAREVEYSYIIDPPRADREQFSFVVEAKR